MIWHVLRKSVKSDDECFETGGKGMEQNKFKTYPSHHHIIIDYALVSIERLNESR